jgi:hypothetical protein
MLFMALSKSTITVSYIQMCGHKLPIEHLYCDLRCGIGLSAFYYGYMKGWRRPFTVDSV